VEGLWGEKSAHKSKNGTGRGSNLNLRAIQEPQMYKGTPRLFQAINGLKRVREQEKWDE